MSLVLGIALLALALLAPPELVSREFDPQVTHEAGLSRDALDCKGDPVPSGCQWEP